MAEEMMTGMVDMQMPEHISSISTHGVEFAADENGVVKVPSNAVRELLQHGLTIFKKVVEEVKQEVVQLEDEVAAEAAKVEAKLTGKKG